jgi:hypothetical protein
MQRIAFFAYDSREGIMAQEQSPITGILEEDRVYIDFGEHEGKSILEVADTMPDYYDFLTEKRNTGKCAIRRSKDKTYRLYISQTVM